MRAVLVAAVAMLVSPPSPPCAVAEAKKIRIESLARIPKEAELVFQRYGEKSAFGPRAAEIYVGDCSCSVSRREIA